MDSDLSYDFSMFNKYITSGDNLVGVFLGSILNAVILGSDVTKRKLKRSVLVFKREFCLNDVFYI